MGARIFETIFQQWQESSGPPIDRGMINIHIALQRDAALRFLHQLAGAAKFSNTGSASFVLAEIEQIGLVATHSISA